MPSSEYVLTTPDRQRGVLSNLVGKRIVKAGFRSYPSVTFMTDEGLFYKFGLLTGRRCCEKVYSYVASQDLWRLASGETLRYVHATVTTTNPIPDQRFPGWPARRKWTTFHFTTNSTTTELTWMVACDEENHNLQYWLHEPILITNL